MSAFIFVSVICVGQACTFVTSMDTMPQKNCEAAKKEFLTTKYDPSVTLAAAQCMRFKQPGVQV